MSCAFRRPCCSSCAYLVSSGWKDTTYVFLPGRSVVLAELPPTSTRSRLMEGGKTKEPDASMFATCSVPMRRVLWIERGGGIG